VTFPGRDLTTLASGANGAFRSWPLVAGEIRFHVEHPEYNAADCTATLPETGEVAAECAMNPLPRRGTVAIRVTEEEGGASIGAATVTLTPASGTAITLTTDSDGEAEREVEAGQYTVAVEADGHMRRGAREVTVTPRQQTTVELTLRRTPRQALVRIQGNRIQILRPVHFRLDSAEIDPDSHALLEQVADVLLRNPDMCRLQIQGHTDSSGGREHNMTLSQQRAESVMAFLVQTGVTADRLAAQGFGPERPVSPNITAAGRSRNRRVEFHITERCGAE
jgi:outer membrane protein OmpA-like peptidoglycan-associated protein